MELLESYVKAVKRYLPRGQRDDIMAELSEDLRSQIDAREVELGRPLRDAEQMSIFKAYGDPMTVARRYRKSGMSLSIGWELIGPELFPMYLIILGSNLALALVMTVAIMLYIHEPITFAVIVRSVLIQVFCVTLTFTLLNLVRRKFPQPWYYPPAELAPMIPVPKVYSKIGLCVWGGFTAWWLAVPYFPALLLGSASHEVSLAPSWHRFYLPILLLLVIGIAQRAANLARPAWSGLVPSARLLVNAVALGLQYPMIKSYPYVLASSGTANFAHATEIANNFNGLILWGLLSWLWVYHLISIFAYAWYCRPYLHRLLRGKASALAHTHEINGLI